MKYIHIGKGYLKMHNPVAIINNSKIVGGVEYHISTLINLMTCEKYPVFLYCLPELEAFYQDEIKNKGCSIIPIEMSHFFHWKGTYKLTKSLIRNKIKIVHTHLYLATRFAFIPAVLSNAKLIETVHIEEKWRKGIKKLKAIPNMIIEKLKVKMHICVSDAVLKDCINNKCISHKKLQLIYNTSRLDIKKRQARTIKNIGFLGRLENQKRVDLLITSFADLMKINPDIILHIGGEGTQKEPLMELANKLGVSDRLIWHGNVDASKFYHMIDLYVLPSDFEGFALGILEAANYQLPVVCSNVSGNLEIVINGTGRIFKSGNSQNLSENIQYYLDNPKVARAESIHLYEYSKEHFGSGVFLKQTLEVYQGVI